jgi:hypothetical protein
LADSRFLGRIAAPNVIDFTLLRTRRSAQPKGTIMSTSRSSESERKGYDVIGDVHGCAAELHTLLNALDYRVNEASGAYEHPERQAIFVGDLVDRGPGQLDVLRTVKRMVEAGSAQIVMGNHEFNAIAYDTPIRTGPGNTFDVATTRTRTSTRPSSNNWMRSRALSSSTGS